MHEDPMWVNKEVDDTPSEFLYEDNSGIKEVEMPEVDDINDWDKYVGAEVLLANEGVERQAGTVISRSVNSAGKQIGHQHENPMLDTRVYDVMFPDWTIKQYSANLIAEPIWTNCAMDEIVGHRKTPDAIKKSDGYVYGVDGQRKFMKTTKGCLCLG